MRRLFPVIIAGVFALSAFAAGCTSGNAPPRPQPPTKDNAVTARKGASKPRVQLFTGTVVAVDETAGTLTLKGSKREKDFQVRKAVKKQLYGLRIGDKLIVKHVDDTAVSIVKLRTSHSDLAFRREEGAVRGE